MNVEGKLTTYDKTAGRLTIPKGTHHTFWADPDSGEPCKITIATERCKSGLDELFFRNIYNYLEDCDVQGVPPSLPQLLLFLDYAETSLAFPGPKFLMNWLSYALGVIVGRWFGGYVLGMKASYPEYFDPTKMKKA